MSDENDDVELPEWQVLITRVQEGVLIISADSADQAKAMAEDDVFGADWETVHWEVVSAEAMP